MPALAGSSTLLWIALSDAACARCAEPCRGAEEPRGRPIASAKHSTACPRSTSTPRRAVSAESAAELQACLRELCELSQAEEADLLSHIFASGWDQGCLVDL